MQQMRVLFILQQKSLVQKITNIEETKWYEEFTIEFLTCFPVIFQSWRASASLYISLCQTLHSGYAVLASQPLRCHCYYITASAQSYLCIASLCQALYPHPYWSLSLSPPYKSPSELISRAKLQLVRKFIFLGNYVSALVCIPNGPQAFLCSLLVDN